MEILDIQGVPKNPKTIEMTYIVRIWMPQH